MNKHAYYDYKLLEQLEETPHFTNRMASAKLGVSVKLIHEVVHRLLKKGWVHATQKDGRSFFYFLTPKGIAEKARLTYEFLEFTNQFYRQARQLSSHVCQQLVGAGVRNVALIGSGDLAEITYLGICEHGLRLCGVYDVAEARTHFMGKPVQDVAALPAANTGCFTMVLVALYDPQEPLRPRYLPRGVVADSRFAWVMSAERLIGSIVKNAPVPVQAAK